MAPNNDATHSLDGARLQCIEGSTSPCVGGGGGGKQELSKKINPGWERVYTIHVKTVEEIK